MSTAQEIKERLSAADVIGGYLKLEKSGKNLKAPCPFHIEKTPSFFVSPERNSYYCFGCGARGDIFSFVQEIEGLDFMGALRLLADRAGVSIDHITKKDKSERDRVFECLEEACVFYQGQLRQSAEAKQYLSDRGITEITEFRIGYAPDDWRLLKSHLLEHSYSEKEMLDAGLIKKSDRSSDYYDVFRSRIIFPITDSAGRVVGFAGRILGSDDPAKYINSPETKVFTKGDILFGFDHAKNNIRRNDFTIIVEGPIDLIQVHQAGYRNAVAPQGTSITLSHLKRLRGLSHNLVLAMDADEAGVSAIKRTAQVALPLGFDVKVASLPDGMDPADLILKDPEAWKNIIRSAQHVVTFMTNRINNAEENERSFRKRVSNEVLPLIRVIDNKIDQEHFIGLTAERIGVSTESIREELDKIPLSEERAMIETTYDAKENILRNELIVRRLLGLILWQSTLSRPDIDLAEVSGKFKEIAGSELLSQKLSDEQKSEYIFEAEFSFEGQDNLESVARELLEGLEEEFLKQRFTGLLSELKQAEANGEAVRALEILKECKDISRQIEHIHQSTTEVA